jgi:hypothetical protein
MREMCVKVIPIGICVNHGVAMLVMIALQTGGYLGRGIAVFLKNIYFAKVL